MGDIQFTDDRIQPSINGGSTVKSEGTGEGNSYSKVEFIDPSNNVNSGSSDTSNHQKDSIDRPTSGSVIEMVPKE